jgi:hypothetical protein
MSGLSSILTVKRRCQPQMLRTVLEDMENMIVEGRTEAVEPTIRRIDASLCFLANLKSQNRGRDYYADSVDPPEGSRRFFVSVTVQDQEPNFEVGARGIRLFWIVRRKLGMRTWLDEHVRILPILVPG